MVDRKVAEREIHDSLRGEHADDAEYTSNRRFYAIDRANVDFVQHWLAARVRGRTVLDYCCGNGILSRRLAHMGANVTGIDISPVSIDNAKAAAAAEQAQASFIVMDAENMTFSDDTFDYVLVSGVLHHLDLDKAYAELARVLKPTGSVIATEALKHNPAIHWYRKRTPQMRSAWEVDHILGRHEIRRAQEHFGGVRVLRFFHLASIAAVPLAGKRGFAAALRGLELVDRALLRVPGVRWLAWMAVFELTEPRQTGAT